MRSYGTTGATHLLEHLMFKGTRRAQRGGGNGYDQLLERTAAMTNATTWLDRTNYFDRGSAGLARWHVMLRSRSHAKSASARRGPAAGDDGRPKRIRTGRKRSGEALQKEMWATAFLAHPVSPLHDRVAQRLRERADREVEGLLRHVLLAEQRDCFGHRRLPARGGAEANQEVLRFHSQVAAPYTDGLHSRPPQTGPRRVMVQRTGELGDVLLAKRFRRPECRLCGT